MYMSFNPCGHECHSEKHVSGIWQWQWATSDDNQPGRSRFLFFFRSHIAGLQMEKRYSKTHYSSDLFRLPLLHNNGFSHGFCFVVAGLHSWMILRFVWMMNLFVCYVTPFFDCVKLRGIALGVQQQVIFRYAIVIFCKRTQNACWL